MKEIEILLEKFWILKEDDKDRYFEIKEKIATFKPFLEEKCGLSVIRNKHLIKLEKIPERAEDWMGIPDFNQTEQYIMFSLVLAFLEDKDRGDQFILSDISEFVELNYPIEFYIDWNSYSLRKSFVKVLKFLVEMKLVKINFGEEDSFKNDLNAQVLYESTGISRYFIRNFNRDISEYKDISDFENEIWQDESRDRGTARAQRVYKNLLINAVVTRDNENESDFDYMKKQTHNIASEFEKYLEAGFNLTKNYAMIEIENSYNYKDVFPGAKAISDIVLLVSREIINKVNVGEISYNERDRIIISYDKFLEIVKLCKEKYSSGWSSEYRNMSVEGITKDLIKYMKGFNLLNNNNENKGEIELLPAISKYIGNYPKDFYKEKENE
ncbi:TIGR02678 family protein [Haliovirga abyssi]|uniref:TIGR02678 family protein n=1 Tax=Haliovirga abyssi TaxID=2996794 RepID=A0AAU9DS87_9FUSO|nr:TIGR02678 family protein [Haliovirga abyssi]BDU51478.1 hypothetical protein HLVA_20470 [Haliovirga abyssi]